VTCGALIFSTALNLKHYLPLLNLDFGKVPPKKFVWTELKPFTPCREGGARHVVEGIEYTRKQKSEGQKKKKKTIQDRDGGARDGQRRNNSSGWRSFGTSVSP
jgi:hypothetical protein